MLLSDESLGIFPTDRARLAGVADDPEGRLLSTMLSPRPDILIEPVFS